MHTYARVYYAHSHTHSLTYLQGKELALIGRAWVQVAHQSGTQPFTHSLMLQGVVTRSGKDGLPVEKKTDYEAGQIDVLADNLEVVASRVRA